MVAFFQHEEESFPHPRSQRPRARDPLSRFLSYLLHAPYQNSSPPILSSGEPIPLIRILLIFADCFHHSHFLIGLLFELFLQLDESMFVGIEVGQSLVIDDPDGDFIVTAFDANHCPGMYGYFLNFAFLYNLDTTMKYYFCVPYR